MPTSHTSNSQSTDRAALPLFVGPQNAREIIGCSWRWCRDTARRLGVRVITPPGSSKSLIPARDFAEALERAGLASTNTVAPPEPVPGSPEELEAMARRVGLRIVGASR
jgi:hypothetical protein